MREVESDAVKYDRANGVATIILDQPRIHNALSAELVTGLRVALDAAIADDAVRVIVVTNAGPTFCSGADLRRERGRSGSPPDFPPLLNRVIDSPKPVIGRIAGSCFGGGVGLAAACDISIAVDTARFGFSEVRLGVAPAIVSVVCLPKLRPGDALELFLTGERITARRAVDLGLITTVAPPDELDSATQQIIDKLKLGGPRALAATKELVRRVPAMQRAEAFAWTAELSARLFGSAEAEAGIEAFRNKAPAPWVEPVANGGP